MKPIDWPMKRFFLSQCNLKISVVREHYLSPTHFEFRNIFTKFRIYDHILEIDLGRYKKKKRASESQNL